MKWAIVTTAVLFVTAEGCSRPAPLPAAPLPAVTVGGPPLLRLQAPGPSASTFWEPVDIPLVEKEVGDSLELPIDISRIARSRGIEARWSAEPQALREAVSARGFAVTRCIHPTIRLGEFYGSLRDDRASWVVTLDALFFLTHLAIDRALADVDADVIVPSIGVLLRRLDLHLTAESNGVPADVAPSYFVARGVVSVALSLALPDYQPPSNIAKLAEAERVRFLAHEGIATSPWLGIPLNYAAMSPRGLTDRDDWHSRWSRALAWLEQAGLALEGSGERQVQTRVDVWTARVHARAALLLARLLDYDVDPEAASAWDRVEHVGALLVGEADDVTARDLAAVTRSAKVDLRDSSWLANVALVDRVRHMAAMQHPSRIYDGWGSATASAGFDSDEPIGGVAPSFRLLAPRLTADGELLQSLVFPLVGTLSRAAASGGSHEDRRDMPTALDVAAWLGSGEALAALHDAGQDAYARYAEALERKMRALASDGVLERHRTPFYSMIDAIRTWLNGSIGDRVQPSAATSEWRKRKVEVALGAWTELRHDGSLLARVQVPEGRLPEGEAQSPVPIFVEPHPEAIARLFALARQTSRVLASEGILGPSAPSLAVLEEVKRLLWTSLGAAVLEANDEPLPPALGGALAAFPAMMRTLEATLSESGSVDVPLAIDVHTNRAAALVLEEALGDLEEVWMVMRAPGTHQLWLAMGASIPHYEMLEGASAPMTDTSWRAALLRDAQPSADPLVRSYFVDGAPDPKTTPSTNPWPG